MDPNSWRRLRPGAEVDHRRFQVHTLNHSGWGPIKRYLVSLPSSVFMVLVQEHKLGPVPIAEAQDWLSANGWHGIFSSCLAGQGGGMSAGCAIIVRSFAGLAQPPGGQEVVPGRAVAGLVQLPGGRPFVAYSVYLVDGLGFRGDNIGFAASIAEHAQQCVEQGLQWLMGGDFNMQVQEFEGTGFLEKLQAQPVVPEPGSISCMVGGTGRLLDFFLASASLSLGIKGVRVEEAHPCVPHRPVALTMVPGVQAQQFRGLWRPPALPTRPVVGPSPVPGNFAAACWAAFRARGLAQGGLMHEARRLLDKAFRSLARKMEQELVQATGLQTDGKPGFLGRPMHRSGWASSPSQGC